MACRVGRVLGFLLALLCVSCATFGPSAQSADCVVVPVAIDDLPEGLWLRALMRFTFGDEVVAFEVVAHRTPNQLNVVGLAPYGVRLFAIRQRDREFSLEAPSSKRLEPLAHWAMDALHRAFWIEAPQASQPPTSWNWAGERVTQVKHGGQLKREFARDLASLPSARVTIDYPEKSGSEVGTRVEIHNPWCGYEAVIVTLENTPPNATLHSGRNSWEPRE